jgi:hypothetical protein
MSQNFYSLMKLILFIGFLGCCLIQGIKGNSELGRGDCRGSISYSHQNSELIEKEDYMSRNSPFRIPHSS